MLFPQLIAVKDFETLVVECKYVNWNRQLSVGNNKKRENFLHSESFMMSLLFMKGKFQKGVKLARGRSFYGTLAELSLFKEDWVFFSLYKSSKKRPQQVLPLKALYILIKNKISLHETHELSLDLWNSTSRPKVF